MIISPGYSVFTSASGRTNPAAWKSIEQKDYHEWRKQYTFNAIQYGVSYGEDFCNHFKVSDYILFYDRSYESADEYIHRYYIK
jgi:hypothetical protein